MSSESSSVDPQAVEHTKQQIRGIVDEITALSKQDVEPEEFYTQFLQRVVEALAAVGGAIWTLAEGKQLQLAYQINLKKSTLDQEGEHQARHARLLAKVAQSKEGLLVPPHSGSGDEDTGANPTELLLVLAPLGSDKQTEAIVEIFQRPTAQPATRRGYLRFLLQMVELANQWLKTNRLQQYGDRESLWQQLDDFARAVHETLDVRQASYTIANEGRRLIGCDRVSVAILRGRKCFVEAVSGQDTFDKRSNVVTLLGKLATRVVATGDALWYAGATEDLPPQIEEAVHDYVDASHSKTVAIIPLRYASSDVDSHDDSDTKQKKQDPKVIGAIIAEQIEDLRPQATLESRVDLVCGHSARALSNALDYNSLFLMPVWRFLGHSRWLIRARTLPKTVLALIVVVAITLSLIFVPSDFDLKGSGEIQPIARRDIFVDVDGVITRVHVNHGEIVSKGQVLVELQNPDLDGKLALALGNYRATEEKLSSTRRQQHRKDLPSSDLSRLAGEVASLKQQYLSLQIQMQLLRKKRERLTVRSPIDGQVISWNINRELRDRPVTIGQILMTVADPTGPWEMEVYMPEKRMGHITQARNELGENLSVEYVVATDPTSVLNGMVREIDLAAKIHDEHGHSVTILVDINKNDIIGARPGATVTAKVHCGTRSLGYVWLHDVLEFIDSRILFNF